MKRNFRGEDAAGPRPRWGMLATSGAAALLAAGIAAADSPQATDAQDQGRPATPDTIRAPALVTTVQTVPQHGLGTTPPPPPAPATTNDVTLNLIHLLVQQKIISAKQADALFQQAKQQAGAAAAPASASAAPIVTQAPVPAAPPSVRVTYVPESVKQEIKDQAKRELIAEGNLPANRPSDLPEWLRRIKIFGDFRARFERLLYDRSNSNLFINFNALAQSSTPFDISQNQTSYPPLLDTTEDRNLFRVRARFGMTDQVSNDVTVGMRLSTGSDDSPVSPNQTLGTSFNKYEVTFDRAYIDYHPLTWVDLRAGRFANPWFATDLVWYSDLNFDGAAVELAGEVTRDLRPFLTFGAFPVENTALDFPTFASTKIASRDKWLYAAQAGLSWLIQPKYLLKVGAAFYDFHNIEGATSSPCAAVLVSISCDTDNTRPGFSQNGNTYYGLRDIVVPSASSQYSEYQYFGLASPFRVADLAARLDIAEFDPVHIIFDAEGAYNTAFDRGKIAAKNPVNNLGANSVFASGPLAFTGKLTVGHPELKHWGDWNVSAGYKYLEGDSIADAFTDPDFHAGGTNAKGYILGGSLSLATDVWMTARYLSATEVSGPPLSVDIVQVDLNARF